MYSRLGYFALKVETTENTAVVPNVFLGISGIDVVTQYMTNPSSPIFMDRNTKINPVKGPIDAPQGSVTVQVEPKGFGYFLRGVIGAVTSGRYFPISSVTGTFVVGETVTGGTSGATATLGVNAGTVYGHEFKAPQTTLPTFTVEIGYADQAYRFTGVRFPAFNSITAEDNIITAELAMFARAEFKFGRVNTVTAGGSGTRVVLCDQTQGLVVGDTVKIFRPSTGAFIDLNGSGVKTNVITAISPNVSISMTVLTDSTAVGDLVMLAPQTPSYSVAKELSWIGGSVARVADTMTTAISASAALASIESFELAITNEMEARHAALATGIPGRFPTANHLKGFMGNGTLRKAFADMSFLDRLRNNTKTSLNIRHTGDQIGSTGVYYTLDWRMPNTIFSPWHPAMENDALLDEEMPFDLYRETSPAYTTKVLLVSDATSY